MRGDIRLSEKHGVNPSLMLCFYCGEASGVALLGRLRDDEAAPRQGVYDMEPCPTCKEYMAQGVILIGVDEKLSTDTQNPYRTGRFAVMKDDAVRRLFTPETVDVLLKKRCGFLTNEVWDLLGIPVGTDEPPVQRGV